MNDREKLIEILQYGMDKYFLLKFEAEIFADLLIANGVTFAADTKVGDNLSPAEPLTNCQQWISVMDRLPKVGETVVAWSSKSGYQLVKWRGACWKGIFPKGAKISVAYSCMYFPLWMPLPQPPKGE